MHRIASSSLGCARSIKILNARSIIPNEIGAHMKYKQNAICLFHSTQTNFFLSQSRTLLEEESKGFLGKIGSKLKTLISGEEKQKQQTVQNEPMTQKQTQTSTQTTTQTAPPIATPKAAPLPTQEKVEAVDQTFSALGSKAQETLTEDENKKLDESFEKGKYDLADYRLQLKQAVRLGGVSGMLKYIPGMGQYKDLIAQAQKSGAKDDINEEIKLIDAMTPEEKANPSILMHRAAKAKLRIATAAGQPVQNLNRLLEKFEKSQKVYLTMYEMKKQGKEIPNNMQDLIAALQKQGGGFKK